MVSKIVFLSHSLFKLIYKTISWSLAKKHTRLFFQSKFSSFSSSFLFLSSHLSPTFLTTSFLRKASHFLAFKLLLSSLSLGLNLSHLPPSALAIWNRLFSHVLFCSCVRILDTHLLYIFSCCKLNFHARRFLIASIPSPSLDYNCFSQHFVNGEGHGLRAEDSHQ